MDSNKDERTLGRSIYPRKRFTLFLVVSTALLFLIFPDSTPCSDFELTASLIGKSELAVRGAAKGLSSTSLIEEAGVLRSGDNFQVHVKANQDAYVYVFIHDSRRQISQLFPGKETRRPNRVMKGEDYVIPDEDKWFWLDKEVGTEEIHILATEKPIEDTRAIITSFQAAGIDGVKEALGSSLLSAKTIRILHTDLKPFHSLSQLEGEAGVFEAEEVLQSKSARELFDYSADIIEATLRTKESSIEEDTIDVLDRVEWGKLLETSRGAGESSVYKKAAPGVVLVIGTCGEEAVEFGSGAVLDAKGHVLTSWHVVSYASEAVVVLKPPSGVEIREDLIFAAEVVKVDEVTDLALLKMKSPPKGLKMLKAGSADELEVGQDVHAIGHPEGEVWTYTKGIISQIRPDYEWTYLDGSYHKAKVIQTQTPINPGSSGSPLLNQRAELIGINSFGMRGEGLNYAVAIDVIQDFLRKKGSRISKKEPSWGDLSAQHYRELDRDKDGVVDLVLVDMDGDKKPDIWIFDDDQDTRTDYLGFDSDRNQKVDVIARDLNKDGIPETYEFDPDEDGVPDLYGIDIDGDGEIDRYYRG